VGVCVCVCVCVCGCFGNMQYVYCHSPATLTEVFLFFFLSCKANARVKLAKMLHCQRSSKLVVICVVLLLFVLFYVLFVFLSSYILHTEHIDSASAFQATGRQQLGCIIPHSVKHSIALLRMGKKLPETCWADWNINKLLLLHLVGLLHYLYQRCAVKQTSNCHIFIIYILNTYLIIVYVNSPRFLFLLKTVLQHSALSHGIPHLGH
jgi:hypothetical protein